MSAAGCDSEILYGLQAAAATLLSPQSTPFEVSVAAETAYALFSSIGGFTSETGSPQEFEDTFLPGGKAISPQTAALCLTDHFRTAMFVRGVHDAIASVRARFPSEIIEVVYAGCGPFAPLVVLPMLLMTPDRLRFTLIDAHQRSLDVARQIIRALGLDQSIRDFVCEDAATYRHPGIRPIHLLIAETMRRALEEEPQVAIAANLTPQLSPDGVMIPVRISVVAYLADRAREFTPPDSPVRDRIRLAELLDVSLESAHILRSPPSVRVAIPGVPDNRYMLALFTVIHVFGPHTIDEYASAITSPVWLQNIRAEATPAHLEFWYRCGFRYRQVANS